MSTLDITQEGAILAGSPTEVPMKSKKVVIEDMQEDFLDIEFKVQ